MVEVDMIGNPEEILRALEYTREGERQVIVYPDTEAFRKIYGDFAKKRIEDENEVVLLLPYYETVQTVVSVLQRNGLNVEEYGRLGYLIIRDSYKTYSGFLEDRELLFRRVISHAICSGKSGVSIMVDMGAFSLISDLHRIAIGYQNILPQGRHLAVRGVLSYHKDDFARMSNAQRNIRFTENYRSLLVSE